jgi:hypothetical protein
MYITLLLVAFGIGCALDGISKLILADQRMSASNLPDTFPVYSFCVGLVFVRMNAGCTEPSASVTALRKLWNEVILVAKFVSFIRANFKYAPGGTEEVMLHILEDPMRWFDMDAATRKANVAVMRLSARAIHDQVRRFFMGEDDGLLSEIDYNYSKRKGSEGEVFYYPKFGMNTKARDAYVREEKDIDNALKTARGVALPAEPSSTACVDVDDAGDNIHWSPIETDGAQRNKQTMDLDAERRRFVEEKFDDLIILAQRPVQKDAYETMFKNHVFITKRMEGFQGHHRNGFIVDAGGEHNAPPQKDEAHRSVPEPPLPNIPAQKLFLEQCLQVKDDPDSNDVIVVPDCQRRLCEGAKFSRKMPHDEELYLHYKETSALRGKQRLMETIFLGHKKAFRAEDACNSRLYYKLTSVNSDSIIMADRAEPSSLLVPREIKEAILGEDQLTQKDKQATPKDPVTFCTHEKSHLVWEEIFYSLGLTSGCSSTLGKGNVIIAAARRQLRFLGLARSPEHVALVRQTAIDFLVAESMTQEDSHYFISKSSLLERLGLDDDESSEKDSPAKDQQAKSEDDADEEEEEEDECEAEEEEEEEEEEGDDDKEGDFMSVFGGAPAKKAKTTHGAPTKKKDEVAPVKTTEKKGAKAKAKAKVEAKVKAGAKPNAKATAAAEAKAKPKAKVKATAAAAAT